MNIKNLLLLLLITFAAYSYTDYMFNLKPFSPEGYTRAPQFSIKDLKGKTHYSIDYKGKVVIINFWATWCAPCVKEFPVLLDLAKTYPDKVILFAISSDINTKAIEKFLKKPNNQIKSRNVFIALDTANITGNIFDVYKLPETLIIDKNQNIRKKLIGAEWSIDEVKEFLDRL